jgi:hypothetical protein
MTIASSRRDLALALLLAIPAFALTYRYADWDMALYIKATAHDIWFDADVHRVYSGETDRAKGSDRTTLHPLYNYITYVPLYVFRKVTGISAYTTVRIFHSGLAALLVALFFLLLLRLKLSRRDAVLFTLVFATSSSSMFWFPATETFVLGALSLMPSWFILTGPPLERKLPYLIANTLALGVTISNWLTSLLTAFIDLARRPFIRVIGGAILIVLAGGIVNRWIFPADRTLFEGAFHEAAWLFPAESGGPLTILNAFFINAITAPELRMVENFRQPAWPVLTMQYGKMLTGTPWSYLATPAWIALFLTGAYFLWRSMDVPRLKTVLGVSLLYQLWLHLIYGRETFLYSMHWVPMLVVVAAFATRARCQAVVRVLAVILIVANFLNNSRQFLWARDYAKRYAVIKSQEEIIEARRKRPRPRVDPMYLYRFWREFR